jgi:tRNA (cytidine/uridine-2'-O-)-methyltransferase
MSVVSADAVPPLLHLVLVEPEIPPNAGNVGRICAATRVRLHLVEPLGFRLDNRALKRAGLDYWEHLDWETWPNFAALRQAYPQARYHFFTTKASRRHTDASYRPGDFLVFGRETKGLPEPLLAENRERCVAIPMLHPGVRSLNLATAAGIGLYEALRQIGFGRG